jgi:hypothetical protein
MSGYGFSLIPSRGSLFSTPPPPAIPSWLGAVGDWSTVAGGSLSASGVMQSNDDLIISKWGCGIIITAGVYNGSTFVAGTFLGLFGGGHTDSSSNAVYAFGPLESNTPSWLRLRDRTSPAPSNVDTDGSGNPVSRHTYQTVVYVGGSNSWLLSMGIRYRFIDAGTSDVMHRFDFGQVSPNVNQPWGTRSSTGSGGSADVSAYDPTTNKVWYHPSTQNRVGVYDVALDSHDFDLFKSPGFTSETAVSSIDTGRGLWAIGDAAGVLNFYRLNNGTGNDYYTPTTTGTAPTSIQGLIWDSVADAFKVWTNNGKQIFTLTPPATNPFQGGNAWTWSSVTPAGGSTPDAAAAGGTFGRFGFVNSANFRGYVLYNAAASSAFFYRAA